MPQTQLNVAEPADYDVSEPGTPAKRRGLPLIAVSGAAGKTSTAWILVHIFERAGLEVAAWLTGGVYVDKTFRQDELHAWELATNAARAREVDVLIQEVPSVLAGNLASGTISTGVFTSICGSDDQCRRDAGIERDRHAIESVANAVRSSGRIVVNADDPLIVDATKDAGSHSVYYALNHANPMLQEHLRGGGDACWIQDGWLVAQVSSKLHHIVRTRDLPASLDGHLLFQVQNTLAATAAALPLLESGIDLGPLLSSPASNDPKRRGGVREIIPAMGRMIVDSPRSLLSIRQLVRGIRAHGPHRVILAMEDFESFSDDEAHEAARILGSIAGIAILVGEKTNRQRMKILMNGLMNSNTPPAIIFRDRMDVAVSHARNLLMDGDLALVLNPASEDHSFTGDVRAHRALQHS